MWKGDTIYNFLADLHRCFLQIFADLKRRFSQINFCVYLRPFLHKSAGKFSILFIFIPTINPYKYESYFEKASDNITI